MDFTTLRDRLGFVLNFNDGQTSQDFSTARLNDALNFVYLDEINKAELEGSKEYFKDTQTLTWPKSQLTLRLDPPLSHRGLIRVVDVTNTDPGYNIVFDDKGFAGDIFWKDKSTLQWGTAGPGSAKSLRFVFYAVPIEMSEDDDEPELIPPQFHELLIWAAAVWLRAVADEGAPQKWEHRLHELRGDFWKYLSRGRPTDDVPTVANRYPDSEVGFIY